LAVLADSQLAEENEPVLADSASLDLVNFETYFIPIIAIAFWPPGTFPAARCGHVPTSTCDFSRNSSSVDYAISFR